MRSWITENIKVSDIRFWIVIFLLVRLIGITNPPLEIAHSWRMVTTNMYARNFLEIDNNILLARVDMAGELSGITAKEFPLFNYLIYLVSLVFGWQHWYGRLINLLVSSVGIYYFYLIIKRFFNEKHAFSSAIVLLASVWFGYSRKMMPDTFSISIVIVSLYYGLCYLYSGEKKRLFLYLVMGTAGVLSKIPSVYVLIVLVFPFFNRSLPYSRKIWFFSASFILITINASWYLFWVPKVTDAYGFVHYPERAFLEGARQVLQNSGRFFYQFYWNAMLSYISFGIFIGGIVLAIIRKNIQIYLIFLLLFISFFIFILKAGSSFTVHNYYIIPFVPAMAFVSGYFLSGFNWKRILILLLIAISGEGIANQQHEFFIPDKEKYKLKLEVIADSISRPDDLVAISGGHNPQQLYFAHRKGWALNDEEINETVKIDKFSKLGAKYLFINKKSKFRNFDQYPILYEDEHYLVYKLVQ